MNGFVKKLCDIDSIEIPAQLLEVNIDMQRVEDEMKALPMRYAKESTADIAAEGDIVRCAADKESYPDGRTVLLFTGVSLPGAEEAAAAALGKRAGDVLETKLAGKSVKLTVSEVIRRVPVEVNDELIASIGIEGVATVEAYREYLVKQAEADAKLEMSKALMRHIMDEFLNGSEFDYDEAEMKAQIEKTKAEYAAMGMDPDAMGDEQIAESVIYQNKQLWAAEEFCKVRGIAPSQEEVEQQADQFAEMMGLMGETVPERAELLDMARGELCITPLFEHVNGIINEKIGG